MTKHLVIAGHGDNDPGAQGSGTNERDFLRDHFIPAMQKYAPDNVEFYTEGNFYGRQLAPGLTGYDEVTELHLDWANGASGGHVIIYRHYKPDDVDKALRNVIQEHVGLRSGDGFSYRSDLYNLNVFANRGITYRLLELGFINNESDMKKIRDNLDAYAKDIVDALTNNKSVKPGNLDKPAKAPDRNEPSDYDGNSIVDYLISIKEDHSFSNRKKLANKYGISNYSGTENQNLTLLNKLRGGASPSSNKKSISQMADEVEAGLHGNGHEARRQSLSISISEYEKVRREVNNRARKSSGGGQSISQMASRIINDKNAPTGHAARRRWLGVDNATYQKVRAEVNKRLSN